MKKKILVCLLPVVTILLTIPLFLGAATTTTAVSDSPSVTITNPFKAGSITELIKVLIDNILIPIGGVVAVVMIMYAGFLFVTARGEAGQITKAKDALLWAVIGACILLGAWTISGAISGTITQLQS
jgi:hypothetical protein